MRSGSGGAGTSRALAVDPGSLGSTAVALMAGSGALHALYFVLLQRAYASGELSVVYPLARGTGPLLRGLAAGSMPRAWRASTSMYRT